MADKLDGDAIVANSVQGNRIQNGTITSSQLDPAIAAVVSVPAHPKISSLDYPGDDTAANTGGGDTIVIRGAGFKNNVAVYINGNAVPSVTYNNANAVTITTAAQSSGSYLVYLTNTDDGGTAILVPGIQYSGLPSWVSESPLTAQDASWDITLSANSDSSVTYSLQAGSTLPDGITLAANGLISGTMSSPPASTTTYNFTVVATDAELQDTPKAFSVSVTIVDPYFNITTLLLPGNGTNNQNNHTFLDSSNNSFTITRNGNATQGTFSPFSQTGWSAYFDGSGDYLSGIGTVSDFNFMHQSSALFTFECWVYLSDTTSVYIVDNCDADTDNVGVVIYLNNTSKLAVAICRGSSFVVSGASTGSVPLNTWTHIAITYDQSLASDNAKFYINGVASGTASKTASAPSAADALAALRIGAYGAGTGGFVTGYISNLRITNSIVYNAAFTPSTTPLTAIANTELLTCQSNRFIDNSNNAFAITVNGDTSIQAFSPFNPTAAWDAATNGGSGYFDGSGDYLTVPSDAAFTVGTGDFTLEMWVYYTASPSNYTFIFLLSDGTDQLGIRTGDSGFSYKIQAVLGSGAGAVYDNASYTTSYLLNKWTHLAFCRSGTTATFYIDGVSVATKTSTVDVGLDSTGPQIAGNAPYTPTGYISGLRFLNGTALYTSAFTPPTSPPTNITNTSLLCNFTNAGIYDATSKNVLETVGDAKISTTQSKFGGSSMYFDGTGDWLLSNVATGNLYAFGTDDFTIECWIYPTSVVDSIVIVSNRTDAGADAVFACAFGTTNGLYFHTQSTAVLNSNDPPTVNTWQHVAFVRASGTIKIYLGGAEVGSAASAQDLSSTAPVYVGKDGTKTSGAASPYVGYIQDLRITKGVARYTAAFTPPTAAFPTK